MKILITGATSGIGRQVALDYCRMGPRNLGGGQE